MQERRERIARVSSKREEILAFLRDFSAQNGYAPTVREIIRAVGLKSTASVYYHLSTLNDAGVISMDGGKNRTIRLSNPSGIPVIGTVAAGTPILAQENIEGYLPWGGDNSCFALQVKGDSMIDAGILSGDKVIVRPQPTAEHGEIVVALLGDEATVKRLSRKDGQVWLLPENPAYSPIDGREAQIIGKVCAVYREYGR